MDRRVPYLDAARRKPAPQAVLVRLGFGISVAASVPFLSGCAPSSATAGVKRDEIVVSLPQEPNSPLKIDLGTIGASRLVEQPVVLQNCSNVPLTIARIEASCECLSFRGALGLLEPDKTIRATVVLDLRNDLEFKGLLGVEATGVDETGSPVFAAIVSTRVDPVQSRTK
jgi:hypothetical protein